MSVPDHDKTHSFRLSGVLPQRMLTDILADLLLSAGNQLGDGEADDDASVLVIGFRDSVD